MRAPRGAICWRWWFGSCFARLGNTRQRPHHALAGQGDDHLGPLAGLEAAAPHIDTDFVLVVPCDTPRLPADLVQRLLTALLAEDLEGCHARSAGRDHYLCALLRSSCLPSVSAYLDGGGRAVRHWLAQHRVCAVEFEDPGAFENINEP